MLGRPGSQWLKEETSDGIVSRCILTHMESKKMKTRKSPEKEIKRTTVFLLPWQLLEE